MLDMKTTVQNGTVSSRPKYLLLSHPRTGSVLFMRMLSKQPQLSQGEYFMTSKMDMMLDDDNVVAADVATAKQRWLPKFQESFERLQDFVVAFLKGEDDFKSLYASRAEPLASGGKILVLKEHLVTILDPSIEIEQSFNIPCPEPWTLILPGERTPAKRKTNPTMFPDEFFDAWKPILLIRHPALTFPSLYRASRKAFGTHIGQWWVIQTNSYRMDRAMYDWYKQRLEMTGDGQASRVVDSNWPLIIDMQDMVNDRLVMEQLCYAMELDPRYLRHQWNPAPEQYVKRQKPHVQVFLSSIQASTRVLVEKAPQTVNLDAEYFKWVEEWGVEDAHALRRQVDNSMEDYQYLWNKRVTGSTL